MDSKYDTGMVLREAEQTWLSRNEPNFYPPSVMIRAHPVTPGQQPKPRSPSSVLEFGSLLAR
jgi:hypothetical protein